MITLATRKTRRPGPARRRPAPALLEPLESRTLMSATVFQQTNLVSDGAVPAVTIDPQLVNPWGISFTPSSPFWISDNGMGVATLYDGAGTKQSKVVAIPGAGGNNAAPTGQLFNSTSDFLLTNATNSAAVFIFTGEDGGISGWNPTVDGTHAILMVDHSSDGAVFKGITMANSGGHNVLLAADFHNAKIDVFDSSFHEVNATGMFTDPNIPAGFAPFNVQNIGGKVYVTYAKQNAAAHDDVAGNGNGFIDVYNTDGTLLQKFQHGGFLNSPWGIVQAPAHWTNASRFSGDILVGNFGSGKIDAFDPVTGEFKGFLRAPNHKKIVIDGLWSLTFGNGGRAGDSQTLFFTAGINHEADGLFGSLTPMTVKKHHQGRDLAHLKFKI